MTSHPQENKKRLVFDIESLGETPTIRPVMPLEKVFDFESHPGIAVVRPEVAKRISEGLERQRAQQIADMATPPEDDWSAEDLANQRRISAEIERQIERMHIKMVMAVAAVGILLAVAIHFLSTP